MKMKIMNPLAVLMLLPILAAAQTPLAGDTVVVLISSNVDTEPLEPNVTVSGTASISSILFDRARGTGPSVGYWISDVLADGSVQVDLTKGAVYESVVVYHLRPDGGAISLLDTVKSSQSNVSGLTNSYSFASTSSGIVLEGVSTYATSTEPLSSEWMLVNSKRKAAHSYFNNVSSLERIWTNSDAGHTACYGLAFANTRVVGEQEAKLAEPALQQELKDQIQADISEWASLWPVYEWDVINEARDYHRIQDLIGWDQMAEWFKIGASNAVLPECQYLLNEYGIISAEPVLVNPTGYTSRRDTMMSHLDILQANGAPLSRIRFQSRMTRGYLDPDVIYDGLDEFGDRYGLPMVGTEFEIRAKDTFPVDETLRAQITEETLTAYFSHPLVAGLTAWTYMTVEDWAMCSYDGTIKLNGLVWYYLHRIRYVTEASATADAAGEVAVRGFKGDYDITVHYDGKDYPVEYTLLSNQTAVIMLDDVNTPSALYADWLGDFPTLGNETNLIDNPDADAWNNLAEYALGGNPAAPDSTAVFQSLEVGGAHYLEVVYSQRIHAASRGLGYQLVHTTNLIDGAWMTNRFEYRGSGAISGEFESVTNHISADSEPRQFIKLQVKLLEK